MNTEDDAMAGFAATEDEPVRWALHPEGEGAILSVFDVSAKEPLFYIIDRCEIVNFNAFFKNWLDDTSLTKVLGIDDPFSEDGGISYGDWLDVGVQKGYCTQPYCSQHDVEPLHASEVEAITQGFDPCLHVVRLGTMEDWDISGDLEALSD